MPEFTPRAIIVGMLLGILVMAENVYMGLKIGSRGGLDPLCHYSASPFLSRLRATSPFSRNKHRPNSLFGSGSIGIIVSVVPATPVDRYELSPWQILV